MFCLSRKNDYCSHLFHISLLHLTKSDMADKQEKLEHHILFTLTICAGTCSILAAGVPGLGQNWLMKRLGNWQSFTKSNVSWKSSSVSPGKPQIMSVAMVTPGTLKERYRALQHTQHNIWYFQVKIIVKYLSWGLLRISVILFLTSCISEEWKQYLFQNLIFYLKLLL